LATGFWQRQEEIDTKWKLAQRYEPSMSADERDRLYRRWHRAVERAKGWELEDA
jgi:glycerol kinase